MEWITSPEAWIALLTLTVMEIVLGIDNIIFISVLANRVPAEMRDQVVTLIGGKATTMRAMVMALGICAGFIAG